MGRGCVFLVCLLFCHYITLKIVEYKAPKCRGISKVQFRFKNGQKQTLSPDTKKLFHPKFLNGSFAQSGFRRLVFISHLDLGRGQ